MAFFNFDRMITPTLIKIVFWLGLIVSVLTGLGLLIGGNTDAVRIFGLVYIIVGPLLVRVYCEVLIVIFKINDTLVSIDRGSGIRSSSTSGAPPQEGAVPAT